MKTRALLLALAAMGGGVAAGAEPPKVPPERVALVLEFLEVTEVGGGTAPLRDAFAEQVDASYVETFDAIVGEMSLTPGQEKAVRSHYAESRARFGAEFERLFDAQVDLAVLARVLYAPIYARHFSDDELRALIVFYRSPAGRKSLEVLPVAMSEVAFEVVPALAPLVQSLVNEAAASEKAALRASLD